MTEEHKLLATADEAENTHKDVGHQSEISDSMMFLFTSESVGEGHPGKIHLKLFSSNELSMRIRIFLCVLGAYGNFLSCIFNKLIFKDLTFLTDDFNCYFLYTSCFVYRK